MDFTLDGAINDQVKETPMFSPISGLMAEAFLQRFESLVFQHHRPKFWARYVNNTFIIIERDKVPTFKESLNKFFPEISYQHPKSSLVSCGRQYLSRSNPSIPYGKVEVCEKNVSGNEIQELPLTIGNDNIICDISMASHRPFVPPSLRRNRFSSLHNLSHPGNRATDKLFSDRFIWPGVHKYLKAWTRACLGPQRCMVQRHKAPVGTLTDPSSRLSHVHLAILDPLPLSNGCSHLPNCVDQFTRQPEAISLPDVEASVVVKAFFNRWVAILGAPSTIMTDHGAQF
ncbi:unnamed protein product [Schistocephalus solidus]|uniref:Integrase catalytic domain-containing protein n=1 Tax=Schistocephalus solidus TaxID=70667 RepID=A0A183SW41_SCHSO|nr:unnamed protein product [Schistocephalus solidus]